MLVHLQNNILVQLYTSYLITIITSYGHWSLQNCSSVQWCSVVHKIKSPSSHWFVVCVGLVNTSKCRKTEKILRASSSANGQTREKFALWSGPELPTKTSLNTYYTRTHAYLNYLYFPWRTKFYLRRQCEYLRVREAGALRI